MYGPNKRVGDLAFAAVLTLSPCAWVQGGEPACTPQWKAGNWKPGAGLVKAMGVFDLGDGPALYVAGGFTFQTYDKQCVRVAKWDGERWHALGGGIGSGSSVVDALCLHDPDGNGPITPRLIAGGDFTVVEGNVSANRIAQWDGVAWSAVGGGISGPVSAVASFDADGAGPQSPSLFAAGFFTTAGTTAVKNIASWNNTAWSDVGGGTSTAVNNGEAMSLLVADIDGAGPITEQLYLGGTFTSVSGVTARNIASWNGTVWQALGDGVANGYVNAMTVFDDGSGPALIAGGVFNIAGVQRASNIARWSAGSWSALGAGVSSRVDALAAANVDGSNKLYVGGNFLNAGGQPAAKAAVWSGSEWDDLDTSFTFDVHALAAYSDALGPMVYAGGAFSIGQDGRNFAGLARWNGQRWLVLGNGLHDSNRRVRQFALHDDGTGSSVFAVGNFGTTSADGIGGAVASRVARWNGFEWFPVGTGVNDEASYVTSFDEDGPGGAPTRLFVAGSFSHAGGNAARLIARWDGATWSSVGGSLSGGPEECRSMCVHDDGTGSRLYVAGRFLNAGSTPVQNIARWNGLSWDDVGGGLPIGPVQALTSCDFDGAGSAAPLLFAFTSETTINGNPASGIVMWNGSTWSSVPSPRGLDPAYAISLFAADLGAGERLLACSRLSGVSPDTFRLFMHDGSAWSAIGDFQSAVASLVISDVEVFDGGSEPGLVVTGLFNSVDGVPALNIARRVGTAWEPLAGGLQSYNVTTSDYGLALLATTLPGGAPVLHVGGSFNNVADLSSDGFAEFVGCIPCPADIAGGDGAINVSDLLLVIGEWGACDPAPAPCPADINGDLSVNVTDLLAVIGAWGACP